MSNVKGGDCFISHVIAGFGNPLLDFSATLSDNSILKQFNLKPDGQKEVTSEEFSDILAFLKREKFEITKSPGGCAQNTLRVVQTLLKLPSFCIFFGGLGSDQEGEVLESQVKSYGVITRYAKQSSYPTGRTIALINGENRSLVAHLGAAEVYSVEDFKTPDNLTLLDKVSIVYIEGFFITHSFDVTLEVIKMCKIKGIVVAFNICGSYVAEKCPQETLNVATAANILIGNAEEFIALGKVLGMKSVDVKETIKEIHSLLWKNSFETQCKLTQMKDFGNTLIMTRGKDSVLCVCGDRQLLECEVPVLDPKHFKDSTGAGDAFAAGFLVAFFQNRSAINCLAYGCEAAKQIIQNVGV